MLGIAPMTLPGCGSDGAVEVTETDDPDKSDGSTSGDTGDTEGETDAEMTPEAGCGNGIVEEGEACDPGQQTSRCDADCSEVVCGDGWINEAAGELCDDGEESVLCNADCTPAACGDGLVNEAAGEQCDHGGESVLCNADCTPAACGDGFVNEAAGEQCDDAGDSARCDADCTPAACGDGFVNEASAEQCDDIVESALCDDDCTLAVCGDGDLNDVAGEQCDHGGESALCDVDCTLPICGDGVFNASAGEECDQGRSTAACDADCTLAGCGDAVVNEAAGEACDDGGESALCNSDCSAASCGDGITNATAGESCDDVGLSANCDDDCTAPACGDEFLNELAGEQCDGVELGGATCLSQGFNSGILSCSASCDYELAGCSYLPDVPALQLSFSQVKHFDFSWVEPAGADYYELLQSVAPGEPYLSIADGLMGTSISLAMPLHLRVDASYVLRACNDHGCTDSTPRDVVGTLASAVGYVKASNTESTDMFGTSVALSGDGSTLAVGSVYEDSGAVGIGGDDSDNSLSASGAVYVFVRDMLGGWSQQAYLKASNPDANDELGRSLALSFDGSTLVVGVENEDSGATGIDGDQGNYFSASGAAYVFVRDDAQQWSQQAYVKASNTGSLDEFGRAVALSADGNTMAISAPGEDSYATGIDPEPNDISSGSGAVYVFARDGAGQWSQQSFVKASTSGMSDVFGFSVALSGDGDTLAVGAFGEDSDATGINGAEDNFGQLGSGAAYVFHRDPMGQWSQQAFVKASNTGADDGFGYAVALNGNGDVLAVSATYEASSATGIDGDQLDDSASFAGAVYVFERDAMAQWAQQAYVKSSNTAAGDLFGYDLALSEDGTFLAVGASGEDGATTGVGGNQFSNAHAGSGAVYLLSRDAQGQWSHRTYIKASNTGADDHFGRTVELSADANTLAAGARYEDGNGTGLGGNQADDSSWNSGAVYLY